MSGGTLDTPPLGLPCARTWTLGNASMDLMNGNGPSVDVFHGNPRVQGILTLSADRDNSNARPRTLSKDITQF